uniref:Uncharacterized protein n=1 Tax=Romanomermis culicivorax TaxID=13658 RepID=A0A915ITE2_ROMCU
MEVLRYVTLDAHRSLLCFLACSDMDLPQISKIVFNCTPTIKWSWSWLQIWRGDFEKRLKINTPTNNGKGVMRSRG